MGSSRADKIFDLPTLSRLRDTYRRSGRTIVWTNGCFDLLHAGHVRSRFATAALGDILIVGLNNDESIRRYKGPVGPSCPPPTGRNSPCGT